VTVAKFQWDSNSEYSQGDGLRMSMVALSIDLKQRLTLFFTANTLALNPTYPTLDDIPSPLPRFFFYFSNQNIFFH